MDYVSNLSFFVFLYRFCHHLSLPLDTYLQGGLFFGSALKIICLKAFLYPILSKFFHIRQQFQALDFGLGEYYIIMIGIKRYVYMYICIYMTINKIYYLWYEQKEWQRGDCTLMHIILYITFYMFIFLQYDTVDQNIY